jgi:hypothetical protein
MVWFIVMLQSPVNDRDIAVCLQEAIQKYHADLNLKSPAETWVLNYFQKDTFLNIDHSLLFITYMHNIYIFQLTLCVLKCNA